MTVLDDDWDFTPAPIPRGYAGRPCHYALNHYAQRDRTVTDAIVWRCVTCGLRWTTAGIYEEDQ